MSTKDFSRGIAAQAHVDSLAWRKAAIAIEQLSDDDRKWRDKYGNIIDCTLDILSDREISEVYGVQKTFDIATMDESEQMLLVGVLYEIALSCAKPESDYKKSLQRKYIQSISQYLHIINLPRCPINAVKNVDSKKAERAILQCVMEYLYLESFSHSYIETHKTIMDCFDVGLETITTTQATIDEVVKAIGVEGLATRYGYAASEQIKARTPASLRIHIYYEPKVKHQPGNKDMAGKLKMALENCGNTCTLSPLSILSETALGQHRTEK